MNDISDLPNSPQPENDTLLKQHFVAWEVASRDTIDFKKLYVDMAGGDVLAGLVLSEIIYWNLPSKKGGSRLRVIRNEQEWIACPRYEWWDRCRLSPKTFDRAVKILVERQLIIKQVMGFRRSPVVHIRINWQVFYNEWNFNLNAPPVNPYLPAPKDELTFSQMGNSQMGNSEMGKSNPPHIPQMGISNTETTLSETTKDTAAVKKTAAVVLKKPRAKHKHEDHFRALALCFKVDADALMKNKTAGSGYWKAAADVSNSGVTAEQVPDLYRYVRARAMREKWSAFTVMVLAKYTLEFLRDGSDVPKKHLSLAEALAAQARGEDDDDA